MLGISSSGSSGSSPPSFYAVSKWLGEKVVWRAKEDGLPVMVVRPGMITGNSFTGASNKGTKKSCH